MIHNNARVELATGVGLDVRELVVKQAMSELFRIDVTAVSPNGDIDFDGIIGQSGSFSLTGAFAEATWSGVCSEMRLTRVDVDGLATYAIVIQPRAWLMTQRRNHRIFQMMSELDIITKMLGEWGVVFATRISQTHKVRKYRVQYAESDFAFVSRMMEDAGISYYFETSGGETMMVLDDSPESRGASKSMVPFHDVARDDMEFVTNVGVVQRVRPGKVTIGDLDYRRPSDAQPKFAALAGLAAEALLEQFHYEPGAALFRAEPGGATPTADDRGASRTDFAMGGARAQNRLVGHRGDSKQATFDSNAIDLVPGSILSITNHPHRAVAPGKTLLVTRALIAGKHDDVSRVHVETVPTDAPHKPEHKTPRPKVQGLESASVVGPDGEEIHTDEYGRVRVQFHWDREGQRDEQSSCWIPSSQPWAGAGFGGVNLPRIGQEVLVEFLGGDPDRPIVIGRVYTETQASPYILPLHKNVMSIRSESTPRFIAGAADGATGGTNESLLGEGTPMTRSEMASDLTGNGPFAAKSPDDKAHAWRGSELSFHDTNGKDIAYLKAEKDFNVVVNNAWTSVVGNHRATKIGSDDQLSIRNKQQIDIGSDQTESIGRNHTLSVAQMQTISVGNSVTETVKYDYGLTTGSSVTADTAGFMRLTAQEAITIASDTAITLIVGTSFISITPTDITIQAADKVHINPRQGEEEEAAKKRQEAVEQAVRNKELAEMMPAFQEEMEMEWKDYNEKHPKRDIPSD